MLGMLCISSKRARFWSRCCVTRQRLVESDLLCVEIPCVSKRHLKCAARHFRGMRVLIPDDFTAISLLRDFGISFVAPDELPYRLAVGIYRKAIEDFALDSGRIVLSIVAGRIGSEAERTLCQLSKYARYLALSCSDAAQVGEMLLQTCGVAVLPYPPREEDYPTQVTLHLGKETFSLLIKKDNNLKAFCRMEIELPERFSSVPQTHLYSAATAFLQSGELLENEISVRSVSYDEPKNILSHT